MRIPFKPLPQGKELIERPRIKDQEDLDTALCLIAYIQQRIETVQAAVDEKIRAVRSSFEPEQSILVGRRRLKLTDYLAELKACVREYALEKQDELFAGKKTIKLTFGTVSARKPPAALGFKKDAKAVIAQLQEQCELPAKLQTLLDDNPQLVPYLKFKVELDKSAILKAFAAGTIKRSDLKALGMSIEQPGEDTITIKAA